jgi:hypothetical protein
MVGPVSVSVSILSGSRRKTTNLPLGLRFHLRKIKTLPHCGLLDVDFNAPGIVRLE